MNNNNLIRTIIIKWKYEKLRNIVLSIFDSQKETFIVNIVKNAFLKENREYISIRGQLL